MIESKSMLPRTQRQKDILDFITRFLERHGHQPSYTQIARHFGVKSRATIAKHITALEKRGLLARQHEDGSFDLKVKVEENTGESLCEVKLLGRIAAGAPLEVVEYEERIPVPRFLLGRVKPDRVYALRVKGDSMIDEHICDGDIALIENRTDARDGEIVVALLIEDNQATLKRLYRRGMYVELQPANSQLQPLTVPANQVRVQGIFRGLLRPSN
ncbi:MAG TPA: transcriptional repressor LexA [Anaerolineales bacterium]|jgi:repressor LexA|nr:transcriptional repressor LexA [Anaerolineales bacterium]